MNPILFVLFLIPIILLLFASIIQSENNGCCIVCSLMLFMISLAFRIFMNDSSKQPLETIIVLIFLGYMVSCVICYLCSRVYRFIVKIVCDFSKWIEYNENSASKSRLISAISIALMIIISLSKLLNDIIKIINLFVNTP